MISVALTPQKTGRLQQAFDSFAEVSNSMAQAYLDLQGRVGRLSRQLEENNRYLNSLLENLPCGVLVIDGDGRVRTLNDTARHLFSFSNAKLPCSLERLLDDPSSRSELLEFLRTPSESREISLGRTPAPPNGGSSDGDEETKTLSCSWSSMENGLRVLAVQDISEMRRLEKRMQQSERLAAMGEMAVQVAHEIRNPLGGLELFASLLREESLSVDDHNRYIDNIQISIRSLSSILDNMLCFSRNPKPNRESVQMREIVDDILEFMLPLFEQRRIQIVKRHRETQPAWVDREMMRQVVINLVLNALQALPENGKLTVTSLQQQDCVALKIRDSGIGIPKKYLNMIFDPGFTTHQSGSGLGLAIVHRLITAHGGQISVRSKEGWGTEFTINLPTAGAEL
jgi:two-component system sensor histidine kinase FlrB